MAPAAPTTTLPSSETEEAIRARLEKTEKLLALTPATGEISDTGGSPKSSYTTVDLYSDEDQLFLGDPEPLQRSGIPPPGTYRMPEKSKETVVQPLPPSTSSVITPAVGTQEPKILPEVQGLLPPSESRSHLIVIKESDVKPFITRLHLLSNHLQPHLLINYVHSSGFRLEVEEVNKVIRSVIKDCPGCSKPAKKKLPKNPTLPYARPQRDLRDEISDRRDKASTVRRSTPVPVDRYIPQPRNKNPIRENKEIRTVIHDRPRPDQLTPPAGSSASGPSRVLAKYIEENGVEWVFRSNGIMIENPPTGVPQIHYAWHLKRYWMAEHFGPQPNSEEVEALGRPVRPYH